MEPVNALVVNKRETETSQPNLVVGKGGPGEYTESRNLRWTISFHKLRGANHESEAN